MYAYHGQEESKLGVQVNNVSIGKYELRFAFFLTDENNCYLLSCDRQNRQLNTIELVETAPGSRLSQTCTYNIK